MIAGTIGCTSQHYLTADAAKPMLSEQEKPSVSVRSVDEEINEVKPVNKEFKFDPKIEEKLLRKKMEQIKPIQGLFETIVETVKADDKISINFTLKNISGKELQISHGLGQQFDIWVYNEQNVEVYKWSNNKAFTMALNTRELDKSGQLEFIEEWKLRDNKGNPIQQANVE